MTPVNFPASVGGYPTIVMAEQIETIETHDSYYDHCVIVLTSKRRISVGCKPEKAAELIRQAAKQGETQ